MGKYAQLVLGPAGTGKSTYTQTIVDWCEASGRTVYACNLDPAADTVPYPVTLDVRELITVEEVQDSLGLGPNGALMYAMQYLANNTSWLQSQIADHPDDYLLLDCPGQIELYTHTPYMRTLVDAFRRWDYHVCAVYCMDVQFAIDPTKFTTGALVALSTMMQLELPHVNVLTKMDQLSKKERRRIERRFLAADSDQLVEMAEAEERLDPRSSNSIGSGGKRAALTRAIGTVLDEWNLVNFVPFDRTKEESVAGVLSQIDNAIQYGEDSEVRDTYPGEADDGDAGLVSADIKKFGI